MAAAATAAAASAATTTTAAPAIYLTERDVQQFVKVYSDSLNQVTRAESDSKDLKEIAAMNFRLAEQLQGFLTTVRSASKPATGSGSSSANVLISFDEVRMLETEAQLRLIRAEAAQQAEIFDLGSVLVSNLDQAKIQADIKREVARLNDGEANGGDNEVDETQEEKHPEKVDLDKSDGLYSLVDAQQAISISELVGYSQEAQNLLNLTRDIRFVARGINETASSGGNNRPISIILYGPPGTGKTTSAQSVAKQLGYTYMYVNAENVTSMWAGGTQKNIAKIFRRARIAAKRFGRKTLLLVDEIDGLLKNRQTATNMTAEEYSRITTFLQMLTPPIGTDNSQIVCMFTTNNLDNLDTAFVNRARQSMFLGYIVQPADRATLFTRLLSPYANLTSAEWQQLGTSCAEYVPRDIVNLSSLARSSVAGKYEQRQQSGGLTAGGTTIIDLTRDTSLMLNAREILELTQNVLPATPADTYLRFNPPPKHVTDWLNANGSNNLVPDRIKRVFRQASAAV